MYLEYSVYSWDRFCARAAGEGFNVTNHLAPTLAPTKPPKIAAAEDVPTTAPLTRKEIAGDFLKDHPLAWILPLTGVAHGLLTNMVPISGSLILMPLFQELEVTKSSAATLVLCSLIQSVSNGLLGWFIWMCRDPRLLVCRALFLLVPFAWLGYVVGVTDNLSFKDLLLDVNEEIDDIGTREEIDEDFTQWNFIVQVSNRSAFQGYQLVTRLGVQVNERRFEKRQSQSASLFFLTVNAGLR